MSVISLAALIVANTATYFYDRALSVATTLGLPVTSWEVSNPTRSLYHILAAYFETSDAIAARYTAANFLDLASALDDTTYLKQIALERYGYTAREASYATGTVLLTNAGGGVYAIEAQSLTFAKTGYPDITYRNTTGANLLSGDTTTVEFECEVAGSSGSAGIGGMSLVTQLGAGTVSGTNTTAAVGADEETPASIVAGCRAKLSALSPNGAAGAYAYVALNSELTGTTNVTRVAVSPFSATGEVVVTLASASGGAASPDVALVEDAIVQWATPAGVTPTVQSATAYPITVTASVIARSTISATVSEIQAACEADVSAMFATIPIGGEGTGHLVSRARIIAAIMGAYPDYLFQVALSAPASDVVLTAYQVATATPTITATLQAQA